MIITRVAVGNSNESYVEKNIKKSMNIISSDDNNRGKTVVMQSLIYALGNTPVFPASFNYKEYYHLVELKANNHDFLICRFKNNFVVLKDNSLMILDNVSDYKKYWSKNIADLPKIKKDGISRIVDPELFVQIFFVGQDKKDTSNISNKSFYKKADFYNMIYDYMGLGERALNEDEVENIKRSLKKLKSEKKTLLEKYKILNSKDVITNYLSQHSDKVTLEEMIKGVEKEKDIISELRIARNKEINRKIKFEITLKELNSLNRTISSGELRCMDCNSNKILYSATKSEEYVFDVSTADVRKQIIGSINEKIDSCSEEIDRITTEINIHQSKLQTILVAEEVSFESIVLHKKDIMDIDGVEEMLKNMSVEIQEINDSLKNVNANLDTKIEEQKQLLAELISVMNEVYGEIDPYGTLNFTDLFTTRDVVFSGAESTIFHLVKLFAFYKVFGHQYPIIVDSFRAEDLSTDKEKKVLELFKNVSNQIIFSTTLKKEEIGKYNNVNYVNHIDYSIHKPSQILNNSHAQEFDALLKRLRVKID